MISATTHGAECAALTLLELVPSLENADTMTRPPARSRTVYAGLVLLTIAAGLASRRFPAVQPALIARYAGDTLWAAMVFWGLALIFSRARTIVLAIGAVGFAWGVELSQLYHAPWLDALRSTRLGALALGEGFVWSDLGCYVIGVALAAYCDVVLNTSRPLP